MLESVFATVVVTELVAMSAAMYVLPVIIGCIRRVPDLGSVIVINILLGWTLVGWVVALALALRSASPPQPTVQVVQHAPLPPPPASPAAGGAGWAGPPGPPPARPQDPPPLVLPPHPDSPHPAGGRPPGSFGTGRR